MYHKYSFKVLNTLKNLANLIGSDLEGTDLREANLQGAWLRRAKLQLAHLEGADLTGTNLQGADLNNARYKEQIALLGRINGAIQRVHMQLSGAFMNAIMASGIALMTFAFRLQGLISTFQEFEKELMNAQSIFQTTNEVFGLQDVVGNLILAGPLLKFAVRFL